MISTVLLAVAFGDGDDPCCGDSNFHPDEESAIWATDDSTFDELLAAWHEKADLADEDRKDPSYIPTGFWLLTESAFKDAIELWENMEPVNNSETFACTRAVKTHIARKALITIGAPAPKAKNRRPARKSAVNPRT